MNVLWTIVPLHVDVSKLDGSLSKVDPPDPPGVHALQAGQVAGMRCRHVFSRDVAGRG